MFSRLLVQVQRIADLLRGGPDSPSRRPVAFVVNPARKGFAEAFADVTQGERPIELFTSLHAARRWLKDAKAGAQSLEQRCKVDCPFGAELNARTTRHWGRFEGSRLIRRDPIPGSERTPYRVLTKAPTDDRRDDEPAAGQG